MHSQKEEDCIEEGKGRLHGGQKINTEEVFRIEEVSWSQ